MFTVIFFYFRKSKAIFEFPKITGKYGVGTTKYHLIDRHRQEPNEPTVNRELMIYFWYPASVDQNSLVPFYNPKDLKEIKSSLRKICPYDIC